MRAKAEQFLTLQTRLGRACHDPSSGPTDTGSPLDFIDRDQLIAAMLTWVRDKSQSLGELLVAADDLSREQHDLLSALVAEHVRQHEDDPKKSLTALSSIGPVRQDLQKIADDQLQQSLADTANLPLPRLFGQMSCN